MKNKDGIEVKNGQLWMSLDKSRPMRVCEVDAVWIDNKVGLVNITNSFYSLVHIKNMHNHSKGWKLIGTAL